MTTQLIRVTEDNWMEVVDLVFDMFYEYLLRVEYKRRAASTTEQPKTLHNATLDWTKDNRYGRTEAFIMIAIHQEKAHEVDVSATISLYPDLTAIRFDRSQRKMVIETRKGEQDLSVYTIETTGPIPLGEETKYLSVWRLDETLIG